MFLLLPLILLADVTGIVAAWFMVRRYRESRYRPLLYMILPLICIIAAGILLSYALLLIVQSDGELRPWDMPAWVLRAHAVLALSFYALFANFIQKVYRPGRLWAQFVMGLSTAIIAVGFVLPYTVEAATSPHPVLGTVWTQRIFVAGVSLVWSWGLVESFSLWRAYRHELAQGRALDPLIVNRFFLWTIAFGAMLTGHAATMLYDPALAITEQPLSVSVIFLASFPLGAFAIYLSWTPPRWYRRRFYPTTLEQPVTA